MHTAKEPTYRHKGLEWSSRSGLSLSLPPKFPQHEPLYFAPTPVICQSPQLPVALSSAFQIQPQNCIKLTPPSSVIYPYSLPPSTHTSGLRHGLARAALAGFRLSVHHRKALNCPSRLHHLSAGMTGERHQAVSLVLRLNPGLCACWTIIPPTEPHPRPCPSNSCILLFSLLHALGLAVHIHHRQCGRTPLLFRSD